MDENKTRAPPSIARWQKPKNSIAHLASKVLRWARSIRKYHCSANAENQVIRMNHNLSAPSTGAATQSVSTTQSQKVVPTADLLETGGVDTSRKQSMVNTTTNDDDDD